MLFRSEEKAERRYAGVSHIDAERVNQDDEYAAHTIIMSILYKAKPDEVKLIMIDPKVVALYLQ